MACEISDIAICKLLMRHGADPNILATGDVLDTTLARALVFGDVELIQLLFNLPDLETMQREYQHSFNWVCC